MENTSKPIISISHNDLDGLGCQVVLKWTHGDIFFKTASYSTINNTLKDLIDILQYDRTKTTVIISDISFNTETAILLIELVESAPNIRFIIADHHIRSSQVLDIFKLAPKNLINLHDINMCSASILYYYYNITHRHIKDFIDLINVYDMWITADDRFQEALVLNELYESYSYNDFLYEMRSYKMSDKMMTKLGKTSNKISSFISSIDSNPLIYKNDYICISHIDRYKSVLQHHLDLPIMVFISSNLNFSIRLSNNLSDYDVDYLTKKFIQYFKGKNVEWYYAHRQVFGFNSSGTDIFSDIDDFINFLGSLSR